MTANNKGPRVSRGVGRSGTPIVDKRVRSAGQGRVRIEGEGADRYEGYLPKSLVGKYREGIDDLDILHMRQELALLDIRIKSLVETVAGEAEAASLEDIVRAVRDLHIYVDKNEVETVARVIYDFLPDSYVDRRSWARLRGMVSAYERALDTMNEGGAERALGSLFKAIRIGSEADVAWDEIVALMEMRRKLVATEVDREMRSRRLMDVEKVVNILGVLVRSLQESVTKYIPDRNVQEAIFYDAEKSYQRLLSDRFSLSDDTEVVAQER